MNGMLKTELKKAVLTKQFLLGLSLLLLFAVLSAAYMIESRADYNPGLVTANAMMDGKFTTNPDLPLFGFYNSWVGGEELSLASTLFFSLLPIGAVLPFGWSFYSERKSEYLKNIATRIDKKAYLFCKAIAVFLSGALVVLIPLLVNILLVSAFVPICDPFVGYTFYNHVFFGGLWVDLFFTNPALYMLLYVLLDTLYGGIFALLSFAFAFYVKNMLAVILLPFLFMLLFGYLEGVIQSGLPQWIPIEFVPTRFLHSRTLNGRTVWWAVVLTTAVLLGFALLTIGIRGNKDEIF